MRYTLLIRALVVHKEKAKAEALLIQWFPGTVTKLEGGYCNDPTLWEAILRHDVDYPNDFVALWKSLGCLRSAFERWTIVSGPNEEGSDIVIEGVSQHGLPAGMRWCAFQLLREGALAVPATAIDV